MNYPKTILTKSEAPQSEGKSSRVGEASAQVNINARGLHWRESLGEALHTAVHPGHPWSGCSDPERVYDQWMPRFLAALRADGLDVTEAPR